MVPVSRYKAAAEHHANFCSVLLWDDARGGCRMELTSESEGNFSPCSEFRTLPARCFLLMRQDRDGQKPSGRCRPVALEVAQPHLYAPWW